MAGVSDDDRISDDLHRAIMSAGAGDMRELHHFETEQENARLWERIRQLEGIQASLQGPGVEVLHVRMENGIRYWRKGVGDVWHAPMEIPPKPQ